MNHRNATPTCKTCAYFKRENDAHAGTCMVRPPVVLSDDREARPTVRANDWCALHPAAPAGTAILLESIQQSITSMNFAMQERG